MQTYIKTNPIEENTMGTSLLPMYYLFGNLFLMACFVVYQLGR